MNETNKKIPFRSKIKKWVLRLFPDRVHMAIGRRRARKGDEARGIPELTKRLVNKHGRDVRRGPFSGMHYVSAAHSSSYIPKLLGSYEEELHGVIRSYNSRITA